MILDLDKILKIKDIVGAEVAQEFLNQQNAENGRERQRKKRRENSNFTQVYPAGWRRLQNLIKEDPSAARLYVFLVENMGIDGTLCASRLTLAEAIGCSERTISRHTKTLEAARAIVTLKVGTANVYCLDPAEVWKSFNDAKPYAAFMTKTLVGKTENPFVKKKLATLINKSEDPKQIDNQKVDVTENVEEMLTVADLAGDNARQ